MSQLTPTHPSRALRPLAVRIGYAELGVGAMLLGSFFYQILIAFGPLEKLIQSTGDDVFLYLQVARNWAALGYPTFDGETVTNGFQPLWGIILTVLAFFFRGEEALLRMVCFLCAVLNTATGFLIFRAGRELVNRAGGVIAAGAWAVSMLTPKAISGMESPLHGFIFLLLILAVLRFWRKPPEEWTPRGLVLLGVLLGLNGLARLDSGFVSVAMAGLLAWRMVVAGRWREVFLLAFPPFLMLAAYLFLNKIFFDSYMPVSGRAKFFWAHEAVERPPGIHIGHWLHVINHIATMNLQWLTATIAQGGIVWAWALKLIAAAPLLYAVYTRRLHPFFGFLVAVMILHIAMMAKLLEQFSILAWYYQTHRAVFALALGFLALPFAGANRKVAVVFALLPIFILGWAWVQAVAHYRAPLREDILYVDRLRMARWLTENPIPESIAIGSWNAGQLAYFSGPVTVVNLDGLVQDRDYLRRVLRREVLRDNDWKPYFHRRGIRYIADYNSIDSTQAFNRAWNREEVFRDLVPYNQARVVYRTGRMELLDISEWLYGAGEEPAE